MQEGDKIVQVIDSHLWYVEDKDGKMWRVDIYAHVNGSNNIVIDYERTNLN